MNFRFIFALAVMGWLLVAAPIGQAASSENPYTPIVTRNVFGLVPIPVGPPPDTKPATPPPKITPNGIMTIFGKLQALFKVAGTAKPGQPAKEESYIMGVGERQDDIEVQKIDEKAAVITFNNHGTIQELPLVAGTATGGEPAPAGQPGLPIPRPGVPPAAGGSPAPIGFGGRFGHNNAARNGNPGTGGAPRFGGAGGATGGNADSTEQLSPEAQVLMIEANRMATQDAVNKGFMPPLPPTPITPADATGQDGAPLISPAAPPNSTGK